MPLPKAGGPLVPGDAAVPRDALAAKSHRMHASPSMWKRSLASQGGKLQSQIGFVPGAAGIPGGWSWEAPASTLLLAADPCAARYLRGMQCQGKAGPVPRSRGGICSRSLWKRTKSRWCFASCSLLQGGGGCHQPGPRSWASDGAWLRLGKARSVSWHWQGAGRDPAGIRQGGWERGDLELSHSQP